MSELDKYRQGRKSRGAGCAICGEPKGGEVLVGLRERVPGAKTRHLISTSRGFCEAHAAEIYEALIAQLKR